MKKIIAILLCMCMLTALAACSGGTEKDPNSGLYEAVTAEMWGTSIEVKDVFEDGFSIELLDGAKAKFNYEGKSYSLKWTLEGEKFHAEGGGVKLDGTLANGVMVLSDVLSSGVKITLICEALGGKLPETEESAAPAETAPAESSEPEKAEQPEETAQPEETVTPNNVSWWEGDWYGWRVIYDATGDFVDVVDNAWDVCAIFDIDGDEGELTLWDYEESEDDCDLWLELELTPNGDGPENVRVTGGYAYGIEAAECNIVIDADSKYSAGIEHMITISGTFYDLDEPQNTITMFYFLRPWGMEWEDVRGVDFEDALYSDMMPIAYDDWYLEQIK